MKNIGIDRALDIYLDKLCDIPNEPECEKCGSTDHVEETIYGINLCPSCQKIALEKEEVEELAWQFTRLTAMNYAAYFCDRRDHGDNRKTEEIFYDYIQTIGFKNLQKQTTKP